MSVGKLEYQIDLSLLISGFLFRCSLYLLHDTLL